MRNFGLPPISRGHTELIEQAARDSTAYRPGRPVEDDFEHLPRWVCAILMVQLSALLWGIIALVRWGIG